MLEAGIEKKLKKKIEILGGLCLKLVSPGMVGVPDRICLLPGGRIIFVEAKAPGEKPRPLQIKRHEQFRKLGFDVRVIDREEQINAIQTT